MKKYLQILLFLVSSYCANAQQNYFAYFQTDNKQPFYIRINSKLLSSSSSGYLVVPKLTAGMYSLKIGFPKNEFPEQQFSLQVVNTDAGYLVKNFGDKGWGLYNLHTMEVNMSAAQNQNSKTLKSSDGDDAFSKALSTATNTEPVNSLVKIDSVSLTNEKTSSVTVIAPVLKLSDLADQFGRSIIYVDKSSSVNDTIALFIQNQGLIKPGSGIATTVHDTNSVPEKKESDTKPAKFLDIDMSVTDTLKNNVVPSSLDASTSDTTKNRKENIELANKGGLSFNSDCKQNATDADFLKIRKRMAAASNDDKMIQVASKMLLNSKCLTTEQVKNLSLLFLDDGGKYNFFDKVYPHVSDTQNFATLQQQLADPYYINRFKAMVRSN